MPYNTRRISLSLTSLGVHVPNSSRSSSASHRSPAPTPLNCEPAAKKLKRAHSTSTASPTFATPSKPSNTRIRDERPKSAGRVAENTPPPSPGREAGTYKIDTEGINDEIVVSTIEQLEKTGNRPHLLKELAAVLGTQLPIVESSANPAAIISSRLSTYLKRPWSALSPCPLGKELVGTHPKRTYFFLTNSPHQPFPESVEIPEAQNRIISPSISSAADEEERSRVRSLSPEIDLSTPELDDEHTPPMTPGGSFTGRHSVRRETTSIAHSRRAQSPPLENDEKEFTQIASSVQRSRSQTMEAQNPVELPTTTGHTVEFASHDETDESAALRNSEVAAVLFGHSHLATSATSMDLSSPILKPQLEVDVSSTRKLEPTLMEIDSDKQFGGWSWSDLKSPEQMDMQELDAMFGDY